MCRFPRARIGVPRDILPGVQVYPNPLEVARAAARLFVDYAWQSIAKNGEFIVALSGGNTPRTLFGLLAVELAVTLSVNNALLTHVLAVAFFLVSVFFVHKSFYGMRIESKAS